MVSNDYRTVVSDDGSWGRGGGLGGLRGRWVRRGHGGLVELVELVELVLHEACIRLHTCQLSNRTRLFLFTSISWSADPDPGILIINR